MDLDKAVKLLKEIKEELLEDMSTAEEWANLGEGYEGVTKEEEEKVEAIKIVLEELSYLRKELDEYVEKSMPFWWIKEHAKRHHISLRSDTVKDYCEGDLDDFLYDIIEFIEDEKDVDVTLNFIEELQKNLHETSEREENLKDSLMEIIETLNLENNVVNQETILQEIVRLQTENEELKLKDYYLPAWVTKKYVSKDKIREIINEELPDDEICKACEIYDVNGVVIKQKLIKLLEEEKQ